MPETGTPMLMLRGPFPPLPRSEVQMRLSPALKPVPFQLHVDAGHATDNRLPDPARVALTLNPPLEVALKLDPSDVASAPSCDQLTESFAFWAPRLVTGSIESARQIAAAKKLVARIKLKRTRR